MGTTIIAVQLLGKRVATQIGPMLGMAAGNGGQQGPMLYHPACFLTHCAHDSGTPVQNAQWVAAIIAQAKPWAGRWAATVTNPSYVAGQACVACGEMLGA